MTEFPDNIPVNKPVPCQTGLKGCDWLQQTNNPSDHGYGNKAAYKPIKDANKKIDPVNLCLPFFVNESQRKFQGLKKE